MALHNDPINADQRALRDMGITGPFGEGQAIAVKKGFTPAQMATYNKLKAKYATQYDQGGVATVGQVEPFNQYQRSALEGLGAPITAGNALLERAGTSANFAADPFSMQKYTQLQQGFTNPYQQQVVDATIQSINDEAARTGNALTANMGGREARGGSLSFGDSAGAIQRSELERNRLNTVSSATAGLNMAGYTQAQNAALGVQQGDVNNALLASSQLGSLAGQNRSNAMGDLANRLGAGNQIQAQNQNALTASFNEYNRLKGYGQNQISQLGGNLQMFPTSQSSTTGQAPNNSNILGGALMAGGSLFGNSGGVSSNWSTIPIPQSKPIF
jgi:hypothetical protein